MEKQRIQEKMASLVSKWQGAGELEENSKEGLQRKIDRIHWRYLHKRLKNLEKYDSGMSRDVVAKAKEIFEIAS